MRPVRAIAIYLFAILVGGALLAPVVYGLTHAVLGPLATPDPSLPKILANGLKSIVDNPFHRYMNRCFLVVALAGLWPFLRALGLKSWREAGWVGRSKEWSKAGTGFVAGWASLGLVTAIALATGARRQSWEHPPGQYLAHLLNAGFAAVVVAVLEELLFRGALFSALRKTHGWWPALAVSSFVYALAHFFERTELHGPVEWSSGLALLPSMLRGFAAWERLIPAFLNLFVVGAILALALERSGNLCFSIGLHGGWIFWLKTAAFVTTASPGASVWLWGSDKLIDGWLALGILAVLLAAMVKWFPVQPKRSDT